MIDKNRVLLGVVLAGSVLGLAACSDSEAEVTATDSGARASVQLDLYKSPSCGCCGSWMEHAQKYGFSSAVHDSDDLSGIKQSLGIAPRYRSCHTAVSADGYLFEGHVPAKLVRQFLENPPPDALGLAVPGMPLGSPGMEMGDRFTPYPVLLLKKGGGQELYAEISEPSMQY